MTELSPEATVRAFFDALNRRDYARAQAAIADHCQWESFGSHTMRVGPAAAMAGLREVTTTFPDWRAELREVTTTFPDWRAELLRVIAAGPCVVVEWKTTGSFANPFRERAPNGKRFERRGCAVAEVTDGRISRYRDYYDRAIMLQQLDLMELL